jgi:hypothetical protein
MVILDSILVYTSSTKPRFDVYPWVSWRAFGAAAGQILNERVHSSRML